jgi:hypothetical protein
MRFYNEPTTQEIRDAILARDAEQRASQDSNFRSSEVIAQPTGQLLPITGWPVSRHVLQCVYALNTPDTGIDEVKTYGDNGWQHCFADQYQHKAY